MEPFSTCTSCCFPQKINVVVVVCRYALAHYKLGSLYHAKSLSAIKRNGPAAGAAAIFKRKQSKAESHYSVAVDVFEKDGHHVEYLRQALFLDAWLRTHTLAMEERLVILQ